MTPAPTAQDERLLKLLVEQQLITANQETRLRGAINRGMTMLEALAKTPLVEPLRLASLQGFIAQEFETRGIPPIRSSSDETPARLGAVGLPPKAPKIPSVVDPTIPPPSPLLDIDSDFDLDLDPEMMHTPIPSKPLVPEPATPKPFELDDELDLADLDLDLEIIEPEPPAPPAANSAYADPSIPTVVLPPSAKDRASREQISVASFRQEKPTEEKPAPSVRKLESPGSLDDYFKYGVKLTPISLKHDEGIDLIAKVNALLGEALEASCAGLEIEPDLPSKNIRTYDVAGRIISETNHNSDAARRYVNRIRSMAKMAPLVGEAPTKGSCMLDCDGIRMRLLVKMGTSESGNEMMTCYFVEP